MSGAAAGTAAAGAAVWRPRHGVALALLVLVSLLVLLPFRDYLTDDTFIHLQFAKRLLRGEGFAFNAGEPTYGATSPLWVLLLAAGGQVLPGAAATPSETVSLPPLAVLAKALGALFTGLAVLAMAWLGRVLRWEPRAALAAAALLALHAWSTRWALSGMETPLALALATVSLALLARALIAARSPVPAGVALGAGALARPELYLLLALGAVALARGSEAGRRGRRVASLLAGAAIPLGPWLAFAWLQFGRLLPNTSAAKAGAWLDPERGVTALRESIRIVLAADALPVLLSVLALALWAPWRAVAAEPGRRAVWAASLAGPLLRVIGFAAAGVQVVSRYLLPAAPAVIAIGIASLRLGVRSLRPGRLGAALLLLVLAYAAQNLVVTWRWSVPHARRHTAGLRASLGEIGLWARERTPAGTPFAAADIGAFGYYSDRPVLDLYGLVTPRLAPIVVRSGYDAVVWNLLFEPVGRPAYLIDRHTTAGRLDPPDDPASPYRFLFAREIPDLGITRPRSYAYSVYAVEWGLYDRLHPRVAHGNGNRDVPAGVEAGRTPGVP